MEAQQQMLAAATNMSLQRSRRICWHSKNLMLGWNGSQRNKRQNVLKLLRATYIATTSQGSSTIVRH